jgi:NAD dependent epimerase/dehydratase family enzyme
VPWIHLADELGVLTWALDDELVSGVVNGTAPNPVTNKEWSKALGRALHRPAVLPIPGFATEVKFGREFGKVAQGGQRVLPKRTEELGYGFKFPQIDGALRDLVG